ncbi:NADP-dependent oxidoreductase [Nocardioides mangrovicus]|uniref:NADP-dependent oxidoreductase n=1 Tax=Nocardioides mangrovicus TaxID=2478913 RepID=A0A3L8P2Y7_9ACTN|nr:NADP-dependent oxidoreductase [Nocardioides mangrovicus]RLV49213.1 NADP-dependent oxidoreductase [Nocardioides mangrovicus]
MRAIGVNQYGGPEALEVLDLPEPHAGAGEVRIRVHAAAVNPTDTGLRSGLYDERFGERKPPYVPGMDAAGVLDEIGEGVADWQVGDEVLAIVLPTGPHGGAYADQVVVPAESVVAKPDGIDMAHGATLLMNALTARLALDAFDLEEGSTVAVTGAAGSFGGYVIELAKADGLRVLADASEQDVALVGELGADDVVERGEGVTERFRELAPDGVDALADGAVRDAEVLAAVKDGGALATVRGWDGPSERDIAITPVMVFAHAGRTELLERLRDQADDGTLTLRVADVLPAEEAVEAHRRLEAGGVRGRLVLDFT